MTTETRTVRTSKGLREYTYLGCPFTRNRTPWCFRLCSPDDEGHGHCGRIAPHGLKGRTQLSIEGRNKQLAQAHFERLERTYLAAKCNEHYNPGVSVSEGEADIVITAGENFLDAAGTVDASLYAKALLDSAALAVNSVVEDALITPLCYNTCITAPADAGELIARGRLLGTSGDNYLAESILTDSEGKEIARGSGEFKKGQPLPFSRPSLDSF